MRTNEQDWHAAAHFSIGGRLMRAGDFVNAKVQFAKAVELTPDSSAAHHNLGLAELRLAAYTPAVYYLREALRLARETREERQELAALYNLALAINRRTEQRSAEPARLGHVRQDAWYPEAQQLAIELARRTLDLPGQDAMRGSALLLAAGIIRRRSQELTDLAATGAVHTLEPPPTVEVVRAALGDDVSGPCDDAPTLVEQFVRTGDARRSLRARYNRTCYLAGLAHDTMEGGLRDTLCGTAIEELDLALADGSLVKLALTDPALAPLLAISGRARETVIRHGGSPEAVAADIGLAALDVVDEAEAELLAGAGIDPLSLVARAEKEGSGRLADELGVPPGRIAIWTAAAQLLVVLGLSAQHANLLIAAGFGSLERVRQASATRLLGAMADVNARQSIAVTLPELWVVRSWIWRAKESRGPFAGDDLPT
jgi:hypothetical protein